MRNWGVAISAYMAERGIVPPTITAAGVAVSAVHGDLVPYAVSALHDQDSWHHVMTVYSVDPVSYTVVSWGKDGPPAPWGSGSGFFCIDPANAFSFTLDTALTDGIFRCTPI